jgi:DNA-binding CsgD family transcriptional regulator
VAEQDEKLIDRIYEAAVVPEQWPSVMGELSAISDAAGALILTRSRFKDQVIGTPDAVRIFTEGVAEGWQGERNPRAPRLFGTRHAGFLNDLDVFTREEIDREPYFTEFLRPRGLGWGAATAIEVPTGDMIAFDVERTFARGPVERPIIQRLDNLRPHLARAALVSARLGFDRARAATEALGVIGLAAAVLGANHRPIVANELLEALMPDVIIEGRQRLVLAVRSADALFAEALERMCLGDPGGVRSIPIAARKGQPPTIVHVVPIRGVAHDLFVGAASIVVVTPVLPREVPTAEVLQGLYDLTPAEARVARGIAEGRTIEAIADGLSRSHETIRGQLKTTLGKTGLSRQAELAALLAGRTIPDPPER